MSKPLVMLLAGGGGTRLGVLVKHRAKPAVPFAGRYRIIDFALSNVMHAGFDWVGVLTQYKPLSLMRHIQTGESWNLVGRRRGVRILPPRTGEADSDWYRGTADAIWQNMDFMQAMQPDRVLILSGDHIYRMDYARMLEEHLERKADVTVAVMDVPAEDSSRFGMVWTNSDGEIVRFEEKPERADTSLGSMGIYLFEWACLEKALSEVVGTRIGFDFGHDVLPRLLGEQRVCAHRFVGYWRDVGTIASYYQANMDVFDSGSGLDLDHWEICTTQDNLSGEGDRSPARFGPSACASHVLVSAGCRLEGSVTHSLLSPDVLVEPGAVVEDSIVMNGVRICSGARVQRAVLDKNVIIGPNARIEGGLDDVINHEYHKCQLGGMVVIGKSARVPEGIRVGANCVIEANVTPDQFGSELAPGATLHAAKSATKSPPIS